MQATYAKVHRVPLFRSPNILIWRIGFFFETVRFAALSVLMRPPSSSAPSSSSSCSETVLVVVVQKPSSSSCIESVESILALSSLSSSAETMFAVLTTPPLLLLLFSMMGGSFFGWNLTKMTNEKHKLRTTSNPTNRRLRLLFLMLLCSQVS